MPLLHRACRESDPVQKVSIIPRGVGALGYTIQRPTEDRFLLAASDLENRIAVLMGGRAAEKLVFGGNVSTGAADDLQRATEIALEMVTRHGMDQKIGQRTYAPPQHPFLPGAPADRLQAAETTAREIDLAVRDIITRAFDRATEILQSRRQDLDQGAELLLTRETITADDFPGNRMGYLHKVTVQTDCVATASNGLRLIKKPLRAGLEGRVRDGE